MLLHVSVCDHHQGAGIWASLKLQLLKSSLKIRRYVHAVVWHHTMSSIQRELLSKSSRILTKVLFVELT